jgi:hypothetical protein
LEEVTGGENRRRAWERRRSSEVPKGEGLRPLRARQEARYGGDGVMREAAEAEGGVRAAVVRAVLAMKWSVFRSTVLAVVSRGDRCWGWPEGEWRSSRWGGRYEKKGWPDRVLWEVVGGPALGVTEGRLRKVCGNERCVNPGHREMLRFADGAVGDWRGRWFSSRSTTAA